jgi:hypothetical protein
MSLTGPDWSVSKFSYNNLKAKAERIHITIRRDSCHNFALFTKRLQALPVQGGNNFAGEAACPHEAAQPA